MPQDEKIISIFVASPSDVADERSQLEMIVNELNLMLSDRLGVRLNLVRWETHAYPGIAEDAQELINQQVADAYDIFIGIMWCRFGTQTGRAASGTVEEYERAKSRYEKDADSIKLMFYFKEDPVPHVDLDLQQYAKVREFRNTLEAEGVLYWPYQGLDNFSRYLRLHLCRQMLGYAEMRGHCLSNTPVTSQDQVILDRDDQSAFDEFHAVQSRLQEKMLCFSERVHSRTKEMKALRRQLNGTDALQQLSAIHDSMAADYYEFATGMGSEIPKMHSSFQAAIDNGIAEIELNPQELFKDAEGADNLINVFTALKAIIMTLAESIAEFKSAVNASESLSSRLSRARISVRWTLDSLVAELNSEAELIDEFLRTLMAFKSKR